MNENQIRERIKRLRQSLTTIDIDAMLRDKHGYSKLWFPNNDPDQSKHADGSSEILYKVSPITFKQQTTDDKTRFPIRGFGSTPSLDLDNEIIVWDAFAKSIPAFLQKGLMFFGHDWWALPVGKWTLAEAREGEGTWMEGHVIPTSFGSDVIMLVEEDVLNALSVGFRVIKDSVDYETNVRSILEGELLETSIVNAGANPNAWFEAAKAMSMKFFVTELPAGAGEHRPIGGKSMDPELLKKMEAITKGFDPAAGTVADRFSTIEKASDEMKKIIVQLQAKAGELADNVITAAEWKTFTDATAEDIKSIQDNIQTLRNTSNVDRMKFAVKDWRGLVSSYAFLKDDKGVPLPAVAQKAFKMFNTPVDYDHMADGWLLKSMRDLLDHTLLMDAFYRGFKGGNYRGLHSLPMWQDLAKAVAYFDEEISKAMYTTGTGTGLEWVPSLFSAEFQTLYRLQPTLKNYLRNWDMPSDTAKYGILTTGAVAYRANQAAVDNPTVLTKSTLGTGQITFTTDTIAAACAVSPEQFEDSQFDLTPILKEELVFALAEGEENCDINGDNSASHFDTGLSLTSGSDDVRVCWKGYRKMAVDLSSNWDVQSTSVGDATTAFVAKDVRYNRQLLGPMGKNPRECLHVTSLDGFFAALSMTEVTKANEFGAASTWLTGELPALDGVEIYVSSQFPTNLNASGIYDGSTTTQTGWVTINKRGFMKGTRRAVTIEFEKNIDVQQWLFVATMRKDLEKMTPSSRIPVAYGYNIN